MTTKRLAVALGAALVIGAGSVHAAIINGGFESGLTGWTVVGSGATASTVDPAAGTQHANLSPAPSGATDTVIESELGLAPGSLDAAISAAAGGVQDATNGTAIWQDVVLGAGESVKFRWRFLEDEDPPFQDFIFVSLAGSSGVGPVVLAFANAGAGTTAYADGSITAPVAGIYRLAFGVMDELDDDPDFGHSIGRVDSVAVPGEIVPVPGTLALFGFGLFGLAAIRRRANS